MLTLLAGCGGAGGQDVPAGAQQPSGSPSTGYAVVVRDGGRAVGRFDVPALRRLPQVDVPTPQSHGRQTQRGPRVSAVLAQAGVKRFGHLRVSGSDPAQSFSPSEIDDQVVLDFDQQGKVKLAGGHLPRERWVRGVTELDAEP